MILARGGPFATPRQFCLFDALVMAPLIPAAAHHQNSCGGFGHNVLPSDDISTAEAGPI